MKTGNLLQQSEQLQNLLKTSKPGIFAGLFLALVLLYSERNESHPNILLWFLLLLSVSLIRLALIAGYRRTAANADDALAGARLRNLRLGTFVSGILWGSIGVLLFAPDNFDHLIFIIFILAGLTAGNTVSNASDLPSSIGFSVFALSPITVALFLNGDHISSGMGMTFILYFGFLVIIGRVMNASLLQSAMLRHKAEASEERYRLILQYSPAGIIHYNKELVVTYCNDRFAQVLKAPKEKLIGLDMNTLNDQSILPALRKAIEGEEGSFEGPYLSTISNTRLWIIMFYAPLRDEHGVIEGAIAIIEDITERKTAEEETKKLLANLQQAERIAHIGNWHLDLRSDELEWSDEIFTIFELDKATFTPTYEAFLNVIHPDDRIKVADAYERSLITKEKYEITHRLLMKDGSIKYVNEQCETRFDPDGKPLCSLGTVQDITQKMHYQIRLENSENTLRYLLKMSPIAVRIAKNEGQEVIFANEAYARLIHAEISDVVGKNPQNYYSDQKKYPGIVSQINNNEIIYNQLVELFIDNQTIWVLASYMPIEFEGESCVLGWFYDITEEKNLQKEVERQRDEFKALFNTSKDGIAILDRESNFLDFNDAYLEMTGFQRDELLKKSSISLSAPEDRERSSEAMKSIFELGFIKGFEKTCVVKDGKRLYINLTATLLPDKKRVLVTTKDITAMKEHARQLEYIAHYDALTGLPNRILEADRLQQGMIQALRRKERLSVLYLDLDGFKRVNDTYGHAIGDQLLIALSARMKDALREGDTLCRLGGDEFVAILVGLNDDSAAIPIILRLLDAASQPVLLGDLTVQVSASIGVTFYPQQNAVDGDQLIRQADQAMYLAKQSGKNRYSLFDPEQNSIVNSAENIGIIGI